MYAGVTIEYPPLALYETFQSVECFTKAAREYHEGVEKEKRNSK